MTTNENVLDLMEAGDDHVEREDGGDFNLQESAQQMTLDDNVSTLGSFEVKTIVTNQKEFILEPNIDTEKSDPEKYVEENITGSVPDLELNNDTEKLTKDKETAIEIDNRLVSPCSNSNSESSEREIILEPLSPSAESASAAETSLQKKGDISGSIPALPGPSDDREDISEDELDLDSTEAVQSTATHPSEYTPPESTNTKVSLGPAGQAISEPTTSEPHLGNDDTRGTLSSDDREVIDLKLEDAICKSDEGGDRESKGPSEDLEAVSDDELLPEVQAASGSVVSANTALIGEEVSSDDDASSSNVQCDTESPHFIVSSFNQDIPDISVGSKEHQRTLDKSDSVSHLSSDNVNNLPALEAEPISEEEDMEQEDNALGFDGDGEAGEIHSPIPIQSPVSESGGLLGEVEPISAEESSDTDGELPSGDEDSQQDLASGKVVSNNFESIESDEDGNIDAEFSNKKTSPKILPGRRQMKSGNDYMETISDEENLETAQGRSLLEQSSGVQPSEESQRRTSPLIKDVEIDKKQVTPNFNEHQVELDYEENEGDEGETKLDESPPEHKVKKDGLEEEGELEEVGGTDKDEGELSDDDCEEGEIKEPGSKKPFVKPMCRFFQRGNCTWGVNCRFLHPGVNDKGNYQMIELPGFKPTGVRARIGVPGQWPEQPIEEPIELPPPPIPDIPPVETAWERGLRIAKEQRKKANERKELEPDFEEKRLNLSVDEERELNKENERVPKVIPKDPYYDQQAFEEDEYYKIPRDPWQTGHYENFEVRYHREHSYSPPYREKPPVLPPSRFGRPYSPPIDKFGRDRVESRPPFRPEPIPQSVAPLDSPFQIKRPDEWTDPWRRSKSPQAQKITKVRSHSRGRRAHRSISDSSNSSRSSSGSSSGSSHSSRSFSGSSRSSRKWKQNISRVLTITQKKNKRRSRSLEPAPPGVDRHDRYISPSREMPRSAVAVRGRGGYNSYDQGYYRGGRGYDRSRGPQGGYHHRGMYRNAGGNGGHYNNFNSGGGPGYPERDRDMRDMRDRGRDDRMGRMRARSPPDRPLPYVRPRPKSASSRSSYSRSRSRSRGRFTSSHSRSSSASSRSSSSSTSSGGSADSEHLYRDLGPPNKNPRGPALAKKKRTNSHKEHPKGHEMPSSVPQRGPPPPPHSPINLDRIPHPREPKTSQPGSGRNDSKYASRNAPQAPVKAKDPLKVVGQKSNIKLTLLPKQQQSSLGSRPNPLDSPPHNNKRRLSERDTSPVPAPAPKRLNLPLPQASALRVASEKAAKIQMHQEKAKSPPPAPAPQPPPASSTTRSKLPNSPQKQPANKSRAPEPAVAKAVPKAPTASAPMATATGAKAKKSMSSRREELLKQLKAVEDAIARKKSKLQ